MLIFIIGNYYSLLNLIQHDDVMQRQLRIFDKNVGKIFIQDFPRNSHFHLTIRQIKIG